MSWLNVDDGMGDHPKADMAGNAALGLWLRLACYSARVQTDGVVSKLKAEQYGTQAEIRALLKSGLLERDKGGYRLHDYLDWNKSKAVIDAEREAARVRMDRLRASRKGSGEQTQNSHGELTGNFDGISRSHSTSSSRTSRSARQKGGARSNVTPLPPRVVCPTHSLELPCRGCAADAKVGGTA